MISSLAYLPWISTRLRWRVRRLRGRPWMRRQQQWFCRAVCRWRTITSISDLTRAASSTVGQPASNSTAPFNSAQQNVTRCAARWAWQACGVSQCFFGRRRSAFRHGRCQFCRVSWAIPSRRRWRCWTAGGGTWSSLTLAVVACGCGAGLWVL